MPEMKLLVTNAVAAQLHTFAARRAAGIPGG
jgi:hypothetical protein